MYGLQSTPPVCALHAPSPSHTTPCTTLPVHVVPAPQPVPAEYFRHPPAPSHWPSLPHVFWSSAEHSSSGSLPGCTNPHCPSGPPAAPLRTAVHARQRPVH